MTAIIVTFNSEASIGPCLRSVQAHALEQTEIVVVDNASNDASADIVRRIAPHARLHLLPTNRGFAVAANLGVRDAGGRYLLFLNPDAELAEGALPALVGHLEDNPAVAAAGPRLVHPDGSPQDAAFTYPSLLMTWLEFFPRPARLLGGRLNGRLVSRDGRPVAVDHPLGACMLVRRSAWEQVGPLDERFFLYCEEVDWCMRARQAGWTVSHVPAAHVRHQGGASAASAPGPSLVHLYRSRLRLHRKHRPPWFRAVARFITCVGLAQERRRLLQGGDHGSVADERLAALERAMRLAHR